MQIKFDPFNDDEAIAVGQLLDILSVEVPPVAEVPPLSPATTQSGDATTQSGDNAVETDSIGLPWDARIHASTKTKTTNGQWKKKRGVDEATIEAVKAELLAAPTPIDPTKLDLGAVEDAVTWDQVMQKGMLAIQQNKTTMEDLNALAQSMGVDSYVMMISRSDLYKAFYDAIPA